MSRSITSQSLCSREDSFLAAGTSCARGDGGQAGRLAAGRANGLTASWRSMAPLRGLPDPEPGASSPFFSIPLQPPVPSCSP